jgi:drug/metabolite transporter (DMT)-like permease
MFAISGIRKKTRLFTVEAKLAKSDTAYVLLMIVLDIAAPILLLLGLKLTNAATVSLLGNFEIVATALIAMMVFHEAVSRRLWLAIAFITSSCVILSVGDIGHARISPGSVLVLLACLCWGFENNCTRRLSMKDPQQIVILKGFGSGFGTLAIAIVWGKPDFQFVSIVYSMVLGFVAYGLSITYYVKAQRMLGAARTSAFYAVAPFIGVVFSWILLREAFTPTFLMALAIMSAGTYFVISEKHQHVHAHEMERHEHLHRHDDLHHQHAHAKSLDETPASLEHSHEHLHEKAVHMHDHLPDPHHRHVH